MAQLKSSLSNKTIKIMCILNDLASLSAVHPWLSDNLPQPNEDLPLIIPFIWKGYLLISYNTSACGKGFTS
jgi:hypothetical protein